MAKACIYDPRLKRKIEEIDLLVLIIFVGLLIFSLVNFQLLNNKITTSVQSYGIGFLFFITGFIEFFPMFFSPTLPLIVMISAGFSVFLSTLIVCLASIMGSILGFEVGRQYGFQYVCVLFNPNQWIKVNYFLKKYGKIFMTLAALTPLPYFPIIFGALEIPKKDFLLFGVVPRVIGLILSAVLFTKGVNIFS